MLSIKRIDEKLVLLKENKELISFNNNDVFFYVGKGLSNYSMKRGSFKVKEKITFKKELKIREVNDKSLIFDDGKINISIMNNTFVFEPIGFETYNRMWIKVPAIKKEYVYGTGETFSHFNLRGKVSTCWVSEHENFNQIRRKMVQIALLNRDNKFRQPFKNYETYYAQPTYLSSRKYFFHSDSTARVIFDFRCKNYHLIKVDSINKFYIGFGDTFEDVSSELTNLLGRQPIMPDWCYDGIILGMQGGSEIMMDKYYNCKNHGLKINGIWIQDWEGRRITSFGKQLYWNWEWEKDYYKTLDKDILTLKKDGVKVLGYCNTFLAVEKPLYKIAHEKGYLVKNKDGDDYLVTITTFPAAIVDLTNPDACTWLKGIIKKNMIDFGLSGWMADFGEYLPTDAVLYSGEDSELVHNTWPAKWAKLNREAIEEAGKLNEVFFFTRAGHTETVKYSTMMWNGDNHVDYSLDFGLPSVIPAMLSLSTIGFGLSHSDIGGYTTFGNLRRTEELYMRWCELSCFTPMMRSHEGNKPDLNKHFDSSEEVLEHGKVMSNIHYKLKPYLKKLDLINHEKGVGVIRPLFYYYDEELAYEELFEYMLGRDVLVAPVIRRNKNKRTVYLPNDTWIHIETGNVYKGGTYTVDAPLTKIPVFVRENADKETKELLLNLYK